jgi:hypothetical protein
MSTRPRVPTPQSKQIPKPEPGTARHFAQEVYIPERRINCTKEHIDGIHSTFALMHDFFSRDITIAEQVDALASHFLRWILDAGKEPNTVNAHRVRWFSVWRFAVEKCLIDKNLRVRKLKAEMNVPDAWTQEEIKMIIDAAGRVEGFLGDIHARQFWQAFLPVIHWTAVRRGTMVRLRRADMNLQTATRAARSNNPAVVSTPAPQVNRRAPVPVPPPENASIVPERAAMALAKSRKESEPDVIVAKRNRTAEISTYRVCRVLKPFMRDRVFLIMIRYTCKKLLDQLYGLPLESTLPARTARVEETVIV